MSSGDLSKHSRSRSSRSSKTHSSTRALDHGSLADPPDDVPRPFEPCAATASFFIYAQYNTILVLHHDTLAIERKFEKHRENVLLISADNVSERGAGRHVVSYDASQTAIVWDVLDGREIARFASFEYVCVASFMRNGAIAFGNNQGNITLFEPETSEHFSTQTIRDPVTALAPNPDCRTFAAGYRNGSILIATIRPFTILCTLNYNRAPSLISGLSWHGSSSKSKTEMLAAQTADGTLLVWSISKPANAEQPRLIRILPGNEGESLRNCWFAWSKNGRLIQYVDGATKTWDVRTKQVAYASVPTVDNIVAIANYGPTATLFTLSQNSMVQQYDLNPQNSPMMVAEVQHIPSNAPPTPPDSVGNIGVTPPLVGDVPPPPPVAIEVYSSEEDEAMLSPLQKISQEMDQLEEERRDRVGPLSPVSSHASLSSASSTGGRVRYKSRSRSRATSSRSSDVQSEGTHFTGVSGSQRESYASVSIRSISSAASSVSRAPQRHEMLRTPADAAGSRSKKLFPFTKARLSEVKFRSPQYGQGEITPDILRREMLSVVFGWDHDIEALIRDEQNRSPPGSSNGIVLSKWLGDLGADASAQMMASEAMTSSDWMLLALSSMGQPGSQRQIGEQFVRRLLEINDVHSAVAILLGLGEHNDAIEAYVSRGCFMEALLLTCLMLPHDWQRQSHLLRKWGEKLVGKGKAELAVRCFSCASIESSEGWFSPRAQDAVYAAQQQQLTSPLSPPSATSSSRLKSASLKLITNFNDKGQPQQVPQSSLGFTPIIDSAVSPGGLGSRWRSSSKGTRDPSTARTATPGGYKRNRLPSSGPSGRYGHDDDSTPMVETARPVSRPGSRFGDKDPDTAVRSTRRNLSESLPSPAPGVFNKGRQTSRTREASRDRNFHHLHLNVGRAPDNEHTLSPGPSTTSTASSLHSHRHRRSGSSLSQETRPEDLASPLLTDGSTMSYKGRSIDRYIASLEEANAQAQHLRAESKSRLEQRHERSRSRARKNSDAAYIKPAKKSPSSPKSMSTEDITSPTDKGHERAYSSSRMRTRGESRNRTRADSPESKPGLRSASKASARAHSRIRSRPSSPSGHGLRDDRGRSQNRRLNSGNRSPSSPSPSSGRDNNEPVVHETIGARARQRSTSRRPIDSGRRTTSPERSMRARSTSRRPKVSEIEARSATTDRKYSDIAEESFAALKQNSDLIEKERERRRKAQLELEARRLSLARRPSAPAIPSPQDLIPRPTLSGRSITADDGFLPSVAFNAAEFGHQRSRTVDPESMNRSLLRTTGISTSSTPIGLPATPRAMRHPRYMRNESKDETPAVPPIPDLASYEPPPPEDDTLGPLLPATVFGQKAPPRSASAPPERSAGGLPQRSRKDSLKGSISQGRRGSDKDVQPVERVIEDEDEPHIIVVEEPDELPPMLPELQHLAGPPPPPPPPIAIHNRSPSSTQQPTNSSGVINVFIDGQGTQQSANVSPTNLDRVTSPPAPSASPNMQRSTHKSGDSISSKLRRVGERIRTESRSRNATKSPPVEQFGFSGSPYETQIPQWNVEPGPGGNGSVEDVIARAGSGGGYRNPKDIRAGLGGMI